jgi:hypothetical protein
MIHSLIFLARLDDNNPYFDNLEDLRLQKNDKGVTVVEERVENLDDESVQSIVEEVRTGW